MEIKFSKHHTVTFVLQTNDLYICDEIHHSFNIVSFSESRSDFWWSLNDRNLQKLRDWQGDGFTFKGDGSRGVLFVWK